ncbi:MAG: FAD-dependent oxidoreductase [Verrucomicrobia bacterium]|nr:FAD-dependent oxidoreductase [Verrucomicrobiota bacterium]
MNRFSRRDTIKGLALGAVAGFSARLGFAAERTTEQWPAVDVLVCGGGPAGIAAALMAARAGRKTLLVERYGRVGGMAVQAMVGPLMGRVRSAVVDEIIQHIGGRRVDYEFIDLKYAELLQKAGCEILLHAWVAEPLLDGQRVVGARLLTKQGMIDARARVIIDATGDGDVAVGAGATFDQGRGAGPTWAADGLLQPMTIMFRVAGVKHAETMEAQRGRKGFRFPDGRTWNQVTKDANARSELPPTVGMVRTYTSLRDDERVINATQINRVDGTKVRDLTQAELEGRRQVQPIVEFLRKNAPGFQNAYVSGMPAVIGVRETRRIRGVESLAVDDLFAGRKWPNAVVRDASFPIDIHNPDGIGQAQGVSSQDPLGKDPSVKPYEIPYGCLVPRSVNGLLVAGRCISGSHEAMASYRVQVIAMGIGVAAGVAAAEAARQNIEPRDVDAGKIQGMIFGKA